MKFKKVGIQAFRAYDKLKDGTFDFTKGKDDLANFISIYAPNGFGKTSFYDAVEYGVTNSISRLIKKHAINKDIAKNERSLNVKRKGQLILRNRNSDIKLESFVTVQTTGSNSFERKVPIPKTINSSDFHFDKDKVQNEYFQSVILSQEWIDAFLREDDPTDRYRKFIEYFGDDELDQYLNKLAELISQNEKNIKTLKKDLIGVQQELSFDGDKGVLKVVNKKIEFLLSKGEKLKPIGKSLTEDESLEITNTISLRINEIGVSLESLTKISDVLNGALVGNENNEGIDSYFKSKAKFNFIKKEEINLNLLLVKHKRIDENSNERKKLSITKKEKVVLLEKFSKYLASIPKYETLIVDIKSNDKESNSLKKDIETKEKTILDKRKLEGKQLVIANTLKEQISIIEKKQLDIPKIKKILDEIKIDLQNLNSKEESLKKVQVSEKVLQQVKDEEHVIKNLLKGIKQNHFAKIIDPKLLKYENDVVNIIKKTKEVDSKKVELDSIGKQIEEQNKLENEIELFISRGADLVMENKLSNCPLCTQKYSDYIKLSKEISKNKFLTEIAAELLKKQIDLKKKYDKVCEERLLIIGELINKIDDALTLFDADIVKKSRELIKLKVDDEELNKAYNTLVNRKSKVLEVFGEKTIKDYGGSLSTELTTLKSDFNNAFKEQNITQSDLRDKKEEIRIIRTKLGILIEEKEKLLKNEIVVSISNYLELNQPKVEIVQMKFEEKIDNTNSQIDSLKIKKKVLNVEFDELVEAIKSTNKEELMKDIELANQLLDSLTRSIKSYELSLSTIVDTPLEETNEELLKLTLLEAKKINEDEVKHNSELINEFKLLSELKVNVEPYLKYEKAIIRDKSIRDKICFLTDKIGLNLEDEKGRVASHIDELINSFFYEDLINDIYKRIDPHPDYTSIKFVCDFKKGKPKLNVCVFKEGLDDFIIPNLYFSTAQLNIMSLSIFLAKALNAKDSDGNAIDCILIDDPIQSMDSINILSTIDLIRSLIVNHDKQIILSTHDENFHNLLKKKIPANLYKSKYFELETFGKVMKQK